MSAFGKYVGISAMICANEKNKRKGKNSYREFIPVFAGALSEAACRKLQDRGFGGEGKKCGSRFILGAREYAGDCRAIVGSVSFAAYGAPGVVCFGEGIADAVRRCVFRMLASARIH